MVFVRGQSCGSLRLPWIFDLLLCPDVSGQFLHLQLFCFILESHEMFVLLLGGQGWLLLVKGLVLVDFSLDFMAAIVLLEARGGGLLGGTNVLVLHLLDFVCHGHFPHLGQPEVLFQSHPLVIEAARLAAFLLARLVAARVHCFLFVSE